MVRRRLAIIFPLALVLVTLPAALAAAAAPDDARRLDDDLARYDR